MTTKTEIQHETRSLAENLNQIFKFRELLFAWTMREIKSRYRQSVLGLGWALIQPVVQMVVITIIFGNFLRVPSDDIPYPVFAYVAILPWTFFSGAINAAVPSIIGNMQLITKIYFPREIIPLSSILTRLVDFAIATFVFIGLMIWYQIPIHTTLFYVPLLLLIQIMLTVGVGLIGASVSVYLRDVSFAIPLAMQLWMYLSPVIYPFSQVPERWRTLYMLNPMAGIIHSYRQVVLTGEPPNFFYLGIATGVSLLLCIFSYSIFKRLEMSMSDII